MPLRKGLPFAMLLTIITLAAPGIVNPRTKFGEPRPGTWLRASLPAAALAGTWRKPLRPESTLLPASLVPVQVKDPRGLAAGKLLVASRGLADPNFAETVVLLIHYDQDGVVGLILNRRTDLPLSQVLDLKAAKDRTDPVYLGGPVQHSAVFALFRSASDVEKAEDIFDGVYLISDKSLFEKTLSGRPEPSVFHVYLGYAGWTRDQLQAEVQSGAWFVFPADAAAVFNSDPDSLWLQLIRKTQLKWAKSEPTTEIFRPVPRPL